MTAAPSGPERAQQTGHLPCMSPMITLDPTPLDPRILSGRGRETLENLPL